MSEPAADRRPDRHPVTLRRLAVPIANSDRVLVHKGILLPERDGVSIDFYYPPEPDPDPAGIVVFVNGLPDAGARRILGCAVNEMASYASWACAVAASGLVGVTYTTTDAPALDLQAVFTYLQAHGERHHIAAHRCALWACSSHVPNALGLLLTMPGAARCAVLCYGFMLDLDGNHAVADAQRTWGFANPAQGRHVAELPPTPVLVVRAGHDETPGVNASIDAFVPSALASNVPVTLVNHSTGAHAFDLNDDSPSTRLVVAQILAFLRGHTRGSATATEWA